jgi:hypothetical protein
MSLVVAVGWSTEHIGLILKLQALCPLSLLPLHLIAENSSFLSLDQKIQESIREAVWFSLSVSIALSLLLQFKLRRSRK